MQLIPQDENKQRLISRICSFILILCFILFIALLLVMDAYSQNRHLQNIVGFTLVACLLPGLIAFNVLQHLKITNHYEAGNYSLPYKIGKRESVKYMTIGLVAFGVLFLVAIYPALHTPVDFIYAVLFMFVPLGLLAIIINSHGVILYSDHLCKYILWRKFRIFYRDISRIEVDLFYFDVQHRYYRLIVYNQRDDKALIKINISPIPKSDVIIMLNVLHQNASDAPLNELAEQMRQGDFPIL